MELQLVCVASVSIPSGKHVLVMQGRRRYLKSGPAMKYQRRFTSAEGVGGEHSPSRKGASGSPPKNFLYFWTSIQTILMYFGTIFDLEALLIL